MNIVIYVKPRENAPTPPHSAQQGPRRRRAAAAGGGGRRLHRLDPPAVSRAIVICAGSGPAGPRCPGPTRSRPSMACQAECQCDSRTSIIYPVSPKSPSSHRVAVWGSCKRDRHIDSVSDGPGPARCLPKPSESSLPFHVSSSWSVAARTGAAAGQRGGRGECS